MRNESCRKCGNDLKIKENCNTCNQPIIFGCNDCPYETGKQIHSQCTLIDMDFKLLEARVR